MSFWQDSNHFPLTAHLKVRLKHKEPIRPTKIDFSNEAAMEGYRENLRIWAEEMAMHGESPTYSDLVVVSEIFRAQLPTKEDTMWNSYLTDTTKDLIEKRDTAAQGIANGSANTDNDIEEHTRLKKEVTKHANMDRQRRAENWLDKHQSSRDQWRGVKAIRTPYKQRTFEMRDKEGGAVPQGRQATVMAEHLASDQWKQNEDEEARTEKYPHADSTCIRLNTRSRRSRH